MALLDQLAGINDGHGDSGADCANITDMKSSPVVTPRRPTVVVTRRMPAAVEAMLAARYDLVRPAGDHPTSAASLQRALGDGDAVVCTLGDRLTAEVFAAYPIRTRILANYGAGTDHIDLAAAQAHEIVVTNTPGVLTDATADITMTLILMAMRRAGEGERELRAGKWDGWRPTHLLGREVTGKVLGLIGTGRIARAVAKRARAGFGMTVIYFNPRHGNVAELDALGAQPAPSLDALLGASDIVSLHCPSMPETRGLINSDRIARMKRGSVLINTARGDVVDDDAVIGALRDGQLGSAGLDVYRGEPRLDPRYLEIGNVVLLPHLGSATVETREAMGAMVVANLEAFFGGHAPPNRVA